MMLNNAVAVVAMECEINLVKVKLISHKDLNENFQF